MDETITLFDLLTPSVVINEMEASMLQTLRTANGINGYGLTESAILQICAELARNTAQVVLALEVDPAKLPTVERGW